MKRDLISGDPFASSKPVKPIVENIGKEFFEWADKGWALNIFMNLGIEAVTKQQNSEACSYELMKTYFIDRINELAEKKYKKDLKPDKDTLIELADYIGSFIHRVRIGGDMDSIPTMTNTELVEEFLKNR